MELSKQPLCKRIDGGKKSSIIAYFKSFAKENHPFYQIYFFHDGIPSLTVIFFLFPYWHPRLPLLGIHRRRITVPKGLPTVFLSLPLNPSLSYPNTPRGPRTVIFRTIFSKLGSSSLTCKFASNILWEFGIHKCYEFSTHKRPPKCIL